MVDYILRRCLSPEPAAHPVLIQPRALEMWQGFPELSVVLPVGLPDAQLKVIK